MIIILVLIGKKSFSPPQQASLNDTFTVGGVSYDIQTVALDTTKDNVTNYAVLSTLGDSGATS